MRGPRPEGAESLCYELVSSNDASSQSIVTVRGTSGPDLAFGAAVYLRKYCSMSFSWDRAGGNQVALPKGRTGRPWTSKTTVSLCFEDET